MNEIEREIEKKEYIERVALIKRLSGIVTTSDLFGMGVQSGLTTAEKIINAQPAADVEPVVRAHWERETDPVPHGCEVIKFARAGEKSNKLFSAHIFPEDQILTVEVRAYNGDAQPMAGDHIPRSEYEKYDPFLVFEFYQKDSVVSLRDTCNWIIDTLEEKEKDTATEPKGEPHD